MNVRVESMEVNTRFSVSSVKLTYSTDTHLVSLSFREEMGFTWTEVLL